MYGIVVVDSTMRLAMTPRMLETGTWRSSWTGPLLARPPPVKVAPDLAPAAGAADLRSEGFAAAARTSALTMRPCGPVPVTREASTFCWEAIFLASGEIFRRASEDAGATGAGAAAATGVGAAGAATGAGTAAGAGAAAGAAAFGAS